MLRGATYYPYRDAHVPRPGPGLHVTRFVNHFVTNCVDKKAGGVALLCILPVCTERFTLSQTGVEFWISVVVSPCSSTGRSVSVSTDVSCSGSVGGTEDCCANARQCHLRIYLHHFPLMVRLSVFPSLLCRHCYSRSLAQHLPLFLYLLIEVNRVLTTQNSSQESPKGNSHVGYFVLGGRII